MLAELREKVAQLPPGPGVYLFKDAQGRVLYVGKAKSLRSRVASYFQPAANLGESRGPEIDRMVAQLVADLDVLECDSEVDALLHEARLIKDIQPPFNARQKDDKSFPYLQITTGDDFPRVSITREPQTKGVKLFGPFVSPADLRAALPLLQRAFKFCTCKLDFDDSPDRKYYRPCILYHIKQCSAPCAGKISRQDYRDDINRLIRFLESKRSVVVRELKSDMAAAAKALDFERAAVLRDQLRAIEGLAKRGLVDEHMQPEVFAAAVADREQAVRRLQEVLGADGPPRSVEGVDIAHLTGKETVGAVVTFIDGRPFKSGYRRFRIKSHDRNDDYASIREVVWRRYKYAGMEQELFPDVILIDGGKGQLAAAYSAFDELAFRPPMLVSLAKKEETLFVHGRDEPVVLKRNDPALQLLQAVRDEAHRFAQHYHHLLRRKSMLGEDGPKKTRKEQTD